MNKKLLLVSITIRGKHFSRFIFTHGSKVDLEQIFPELTNIPVGTTYSIG
jgi:hypothetical protein